MNVNSHAPDFRVGPRLEGNVFIHGVICLVMLAWAFVQLYIEFSTGPGHLSSTIPEALYTNLSYLMFWLRIIPSMLVLFAGFQLLSGRVLLAVAYAMTFLVHLVAVLVTDRAQIVQGLVSVFGL